MTKTFLAISILSMALAISACGTGGSGSSGDGGGDVPAPPTANGSAEILFPSSNAGASAPSITVSGTASDPDGVSGVTVNGVAANLAAAVATSAASKPTAQAGPVANAVRNDTQVVWSAEIPLAGGDNEIEVVVTDAAGSVTPIANKASVSYVEVPIYFTLDPNSTRIVGLTQRSATNPVQSLVEYNYDTGEQVVYDEYSDNASHSCFRPFENDLVYLAIDSSLTWSVRKFNLTTRESELLASLPSQYLELDANHRAGYIREFVCGGTNSSAYLLVTFVGQGGGMYTKSRVVEMDLASNSFSVLAETPPAPAPQLAVYDISLDDDMIVGMYDISPQRPLVGVSLTDGSLMELTPGLNAGGGELHAATTSGLVYIAAYDGIEIIGLDPVSKQSVSQVGPDDPYVFSQIRDMDLDATNDRVIVSDSALEMLIAIDLATGERSDFRSRRIGAGVSLVAPRELEITADGRKAYIFDDGGNASERLFEVDLGTGDRVEVGDVNRTNNEIAHGIALDEAGRRVFVAFRDSILEVDLDTSTVRTVADVRFSALESISDILFDPDTGRLFAIDVPTGAVYLVDLPSGFAGVVSQAGVKGSGPEFEALVTSDWTETGEAIFVGDQASGIIYRVDLETGDRQQIPNACRDENSNYQEDLMEIRYNPAGNELLIIEDSTYALDLDTNQCSVMSRSGGFLSVLPRSNGQIFVTVFGALGQYDPVSGELVTISR